MAPDPQFLYKLTMLVVPTPPGHATGQAHVAGARAPGPTRSRPYPRGSVHAGPQPLLPANGRSPAQPAGFLDGITWVKVANAREAADAVQHGRADLAELTPLARNAAVRVARRRLSRSRRRAASTSDVMQGTAFAALNSPAPPFDNRLARRAFNFAVDREKAVDIVGGPSVAIPTCQLMPPGMPSYRQYCPYTTAHRAGRYSGPDLARARALVDASGTRGMEVTVADIVGDASALVDTSPRSCAQSDTG